MHGEVYAINVSRGMAAVKTDEAGFTIIELFDDDLEIGDKLRWRDDTGLGDQKYFNATQECQMHVYAQNHWISHNQLSQQLLICPGHQVKINQ